MTKTQSGIHSFQLFIFPAVFMILQILLKTECKWFFLSWHDPVYAFLFNGLNIAQGNLQLGLSGFPGTTLQCLVALNLWICKLFSGGTPLAESVLANPEYYLNILSYEIIALNTIALLLLGLVTFKRLNNLPVALALQLTPFVSLKAFSANSVIMLEPLMLCIEILLLMLLATYTFGTEKNRKVKNLTVLAVLVALGIATKIVFIPVIISSFVCHWRNTAQIYLCCPDPGIPGDFSDTHIPYFFLISGMEQKPGDTHWSIRLRQLLTF